MNGQGPKTLSVNRPYIESTLSDSQAHFISQMIQQFVISSGFKL